MIPISNKQITLIFTLSLLFACNQQAEQRTAFDKPEAQKNIAAVLDSFNSKAAQTDFNGYFNLLTDDAIFIGTDAKENWDKKSFMAFAKPYFDKGKAWNFTSLERHIFFDTTGNIAWFDELLNTQMKICRGSGVLVKLNNDWKIKQYVLSMTIPNEQVDTVVGLKSALETPLIDQLKR
jgi:SnoaL-like domain